MSVPDGPPQPLVSRLVADAESSAGSGRYREALVLLRWASRICADEVLPTVLLAYHRVRAARPPEAGWRRGSEAAADGVHPQDGERRAVHSDQLGFPVPRFPTGPLTIDTGGFVPAPRGGAVRGPARGASPAPVRQQRRSGVLPLAVVAAGLLAVGWSGIGRPAGGWGGLLQHTPFGSHNGDPSTGAGATTPAVLLARGTALLAAGDTGAAVVTLDSASAHAAASYQDARQAAELLGRLPGEETRAAEAYLRAFEAGLPREEWDAVAAALERAGRLQQAERLRSLSRGPR